MKNFLKKALLYNIFLLGRIICLGLWINIAGLRYVVML